MKKSLHHCFALGEQSIGSHISTDEKFCPYCGAQLK